ncbi:hypothetical protein [uncultured Shewanella sp.]|uniref:hypothetical protein n=1 Tax=uncultured Shewanella sp. TaxID=173975 RepID=UPI00262E20BD|nr:hypothetical protein [uncultured Shewanella sp.]
MKKLIKTLAFLTTIITFMLAADEVDTTPNTHFLSTGKLKAEYEADRLSAFTVNEQGTLPKTINKNSQQSDTRLLTIKDTVLTGNLIIKLKKDVSSTEFLFQYDIEPEWESNQLLLAFVPQHTNLIDFFSLRDQIKQDSNVIWVQVDKTKRHHIAN